MEERKREKTGMQSTKEEKNKKPRTRRVSKYTLSLFPTHTLSLSRAQSKLKQENRPTRKDVVKHSTTPVR